MIKTLQKKFVMTAMIAVSILMLLMLGAINLFNYLSVNIQIDKTLNMITEKYVHPNNDRGFQENMPPIHKQIETRNIKTISPFFVVQFSTDRQVISTDLTHNVSITEEKAIELAMKVFESGRTSGSMDGFKYQVKHFKKGTSMLIFMDTWGQMFAFLRVVLISFGTGMIFWTLTLFVVLYLSKKAINPVIQNIERQKQFVINAGHEIKTPLAIILANTDAMELYNGENKWSKNIREQINRLSGLMNNFLLLARMDENTAEVTAIDFSLSHLLEEVISAFHEPMQLRGIILQSSIQPNVWIRANREDILQLISILMDNALKYTNNDGRVEVNFQKNEKVMKLQVRNTCETLPDASPDKLFDRFYRGDVARTQKSGGYGIGLSVVQAIVEVNKGEIWAEYEEENRICFTVIL